MTSEINPALQGSPDVAGAGEQDDAVRIANRVLDRVNADPDDDIAILARQFLRAREALTSAHLSGIREGREEAAKLFTQKADAWDASASMSSTSAGIQQRAIAHALRAAVLDLRALPDPPAGGKTT